MDVPNAIAIAEDLADALDQELTNAREEQALLSSLSVDGLLKRAALREAFNARVSYVQRELDQVLGRAGGQRSPRWDSPVLDLTLSRIRDLAARLKKQDQLNIAIATRTLSFVQAYMSAICPKASAYDRYGRQTPLAPDRGSVSQRI